MKSKPKANEEPLRKGASDSFPPFPFPKKVAAAIRNANSAVGNNQIPPELASALNKMRKKQGNQLLEDHKHVFAVLQRHLSPSFSDLSVPDALQNLWACFDKTDREVGPFF